MLDMSNCRFGSIIERPTSVLYPVTAEGQALEHILESGQGHVRPSSGTAGTIFVGFSIVQNLQPTTSVQFDSITVPAVAPYTVTLTFAPDAYTDLLVKTADGTVWTYQASNPSTGQYTLNSNVITFGGTTSAGQVCTFVYRYNLTVVQAIAMFGDQPIGRPVSAFVNSISTVASGDVYTDQYDTSADWSSCYNISSVLTAGANGRVTLNGTGANITTAVNARVLHAPSSDYPYLGLQIRN